MIFPPTTYKRNRRDPQSEQRLGAFASPCHQGSSIFQHCCLRAPASFQLLERCMSQNPKCLGHVFGGVSTVDVLRKTALLRALVHGLVYIGKATNTQANLANQQGHVQSNQNGRCMLSGSPMRNQELGGLTHSNPRAAQTSFRSLVEWAFESNLLSLEAEAWSMAFEGVCIHLFCLLIALSALSASPVQKDCCSSKNYTTYNMGWTDCYIRVPGTVLRLWCLRNAANYDRRAFGCLAYAASMYTLPVTHVHMALTTFSILCEGAFSTNLDLGRLRQGYGHSSNGSNGINGICIHYDHSKRLGPKPIKNRTHVLTFLNRSEFNKLWTKTKRLLQLQKQHRHRVYVDFLEPSLWMIGNYASTILRTSSRSIIW